MEWNDTHEKTFLNGIHKRKQNTKWSMLVGTLLSQKVNRRQFYKTQIILPIYQFVS